MTAPPTPNLSASAPRLVGARVTRREDRRLLRGLGDFIDDRRLHGLRHVAFRRSDIAHGRLNGIDAEEARSMPGVTAVFTAEDLAGTVRPIRATSRMSDYYPTPLWPLVPDILRYAGEPVAAVVAESRYIAEDAADRIALDIDALPAEADPGRATQPTAPTIHGEAGSNVLATRQFARGEVDDAMAFAAFRVGGRFRVHRKTPMALEPRGAVASYDRRTRMLDLCATTQVPGIVRDALAEILTLPGSRIRVSTPDVGGGFGAKTALYAEDICLAAIALRLGRPVKWFGDRREDLRATTQAFDEILETGLGFDEDGRIVALEADAMCDVGSYSVYPWTACIEPVQVVSFLPGPYRVGNYRARARAVATPKPAGGPYRGVGRPISTFVMERMMDMAARQLGLDPVEIRRRNMVAEDEFPYRTASGIVWDRSSFLDCLETACREVGYDSLRAEQAEARAEGRLVGIGIASYAELTGLGSRISAAPGMPVNTGTETASVAVDATGAVTATFGVPSQGQGTETTLTQIVADELGVRMDDVETVIGDSATLGHMTGTYASRGAVLGGGAAILAARGAREKIVRCASHLLEAAESDIEIGGGEIRVAGTDRSMSLKELARAVYSDMGRVPKPIRDEIGNLEATGVYDPFTATATSATHIAAIEIDRETFGVTVTRYIAAEDCGRVINPMIADGQAHGGIAQGIGAALMEEMIYDEGGQLLTATLADYVIPGSCDIPRMGVTHLEAEPPGTLGGFRGLGEGGTIGAVGAVANALADALAPLGVEVRELPLTPARIHALIEEAGR